MSNFCFTRLFSRKLLFSQVGGGLHIYIYYQANAIAHEIRLTSKQFKKRKSRPIKAIVLLCAEELDAAMKGRFQYRPTEP